MDQIEIIGSWIREIERELSGGSDRENWVKDQRENWVEDHIERIGSRTREKELSEGSDRENWVTIREKEREN